MKSPGFYFGIDQSLFNPTTLTMAQAVGTPWTIGFRTGFLRHRYQEQQDDHNSHNSDPGSSMVI